MLLAVAISDPFLSSAVFASWSRHMKPAEQLLSVVFDGELHSVPTTGQCSKKEWKKKVISIVNDWKKDHHQSPLGKLPLRQASPALAALYNLVERFNAAPTVAEGQGA